MMKKTLATILALALTTVSMTALAQEASLPSAAAAAADAAQQVIDLADMLKYGSRDTAQSKSVSELQQKLIDLGYLKGKADGIFGPRTDAALKEFQLANGLTGSGYYDAETQVKIASSDAVRRDSYVENYYVDTDNYTPDYNTPNTPDYNTNNTPDYNTPVKKTTASTTPKAAAIKTTNRNSPDTPDYNTPDTPDRNTPDSPDYNT